MGLEETAYRLLSEATWRVLNEAAGGHGGHEHVEHSEGHGGSEAVASEEGGGHGESEGGGESRIAANLLCLLVFWIIIWVSARLAALTRLSPLLYYLLFGCVIGNIEISAMDIHNSHFLKTFSVFAISILFFALGLEENVGNFLAGIKKAWGIALIGALVPFAVGFGCTSLFWPDSGPEVALMGGLAVTATAVSLTMLALKAEGLANGNAAMGIMTSAVLDDIGSLAMVAICVPIATGEGEVSVVGILQIMSKAGGFFVLVAFVHVVIMPAQVDNKYLKDIMSWKKFGIKNILEWNNGAQALLASLFYGMAWCMLAILFGFHPAIGAYMGGLIMEEGYYETKNGKNKYHDVLHHIEAVAYGWMGPFFFLELGSTIVVDVAILTSVAGYTLIFFVLLFIGQFVSAAGAARYVPGGFSVEDSIMIGFGMMGRAELFFVVLELCYVQYHIMDRAQLCCFAFVAMLMNISVPVAITLYKPYYVKYLEREGLAPKKEEEGHDAEHGHGEHSGAPKELEGEGSTPAAQKAHVENGTGATSYGDPRLKDLDGVELCVTDDTPRSTLTEDANYVRSASTLTQDGDAQDRRANAAKPFRDNSDTIAVGILPRICGCIAADEPMHPNDRARNLR